MVFFNISSLTTGDGWFAWFHQENPTVRYPTAKQWKAFAADSFTVGEWVTERYRYILEGHLHRFPSTTKATFVIECDRLAVQQTNGLQFLTMVKWYCYCSHEGELNAFTSACRTLC